MGQKISLILKRSLGRRAAGVLGVLAEHWPRAFGESFGVGFNGIKCLISRAYIYYPSFIKCRGRVDDPIRFEFPFFIACFYINGIDVFVIASKINDPILSYCWCGVVEHA